ncbi:MAG: Spi family protease inhibitor, partial [Muribaculaceae bacterium]|nr:Spi family protease inhibitor [Muribaculaceae bacterium]
MKRLRHLLWGLLAFSCTTTDMEPTLSVAQPDRDTPSVKYLSPKEAGNIATAFMASLDGDGERSRGDKTRKVSEVSLLNSKTITRSAETDTTFYVVNFEEGGYSLIAADRELDNNVYVYSPDGEFSSD